MPESVPLRPQLTKFAHELANTRPGDTDHLAHEWWDKIVRGEAKGIGAIARAEQIDRTYVTRVLCLAFLAPTITKAIVEGGHPAELTAKQLINSALKIPLLWTDQRGFSQTA